MKLLALIFLLLNISAAVASGSPDLCVLVFEKKNSNLARSSQKFYGTIPDTKIVIEARPMDFLKCIEDGYQEIVFLAHGFWRQDLKRAEPVFQLGYFVSNDGTYETRLFLNKIFEMAHDALKAEKALTGTTRLKKLRFAACGIESLLSTHPHFAKIITEFVSSYDEAPKLGWVLRNLTRDDKGLKRSVDYSWLSKSSRCEKASSWVTSYSLGETCFSDREGQGCDRASAKYCIPKSF